ncbi:RNA polymerase sigma factor [Brevibacillus choshinensis]|uniref:RNA polymerase sigma factor n=1 Tax=Brevibacillus choshinensis TaxID=54911 RepID=UPI002E1CEF31|nr:RNA polymerase sigma factor [Brevibacillus choshinensis]
MTAASFARLEHFLPELKLVCLQLAKNHWDAQDLMQETLTKLYRSIEISPDRELSKSYIKRIATNAWIDHCRKKQMSPADEFLEEMYPVDATHHFSIREMFEQLAGRLNARQMVLILLMDLFSFTAPETAKLLHTTTGAVKEGVKRARQRLQALTAQVKVEDEKPLKPATRKKQRAIAPRSANESVTKEMLEQFLEAFRAGDPLAICRTYFLLTEKGMSVERVAVVGDRLTFTVRDPNGHLLSFFQNC